MFVFSLLVVLQEVEHDSVPGALDWGDGHEVGGDSIRVGACKQLYVRKYVQNYIKIRNNV